MQKNVYIGSATGQIDTITKEYIHFTDDTGKSRQIRVQPPFSDCSSNIVGIRKLDGDPWTVNLSGYDKGVTFIFESYNAAYELLLSPLAELGFYTLDAT